MFYKRNRHYMLNARENIMLLHLLYDWNSKLQFKVESLILRSDDGVIFSTH